MPAKQCHICSVLPVPTTQACRRLRELKSLHCPRIFSVFFLTFLFLSLVSQGHKATAIRLFDGLLVPTITVQTSGLFLLKLTKKGRFQRGETVRFLCLPFNLARERFGTSAPMGVSRQKPAPCVCHVVLASGPTCRQQTAGRAAHLRPAAGSAKWEENLGNMVERERAQTHRKQSFFLVKELLLSFVLPSCVGNLTSFLILRCKSKNVAVCLSCV